MVSELELRNFLLRPRKLHNADRDWTMNAFGYGKAGEG